MLTLVYVPIDWEKLDGNIVTRARDVIAHTLFESRDSDDDQPTKTDRDTAARFTPTGATLPDPDGDCTVIVMIADRADVIAYETARADIG